MFIHVYVLYACTHACIWPIAECSQAEGHCYLKVSKLPLGEADEQREAVPACGGPGTWAEMPFESRFSLAVPHGFISRPPAAPLTASLGGHPCL